MKWINVKDQVPADAQTVFTINAKTDYLPIKAWYDGVIKEFIYMEIGGCGFCLSVTHWMPLPERPRD